MDSGVNSATLNKQELQPGQAATDSGQRGACTGKKRDFDKLLSYLAPLRLCEIPSFFRNHWLCWRCDRRFITGSNYGRPQES